MGKKQYKPEVSLKNKEQKYIIDRVVMVTGLIGPIASVPQAIQFFSTQDADGVSLVTWSLFIVTSGALLVYGIVHRLTPIIVSNICWEIVQTVVVIGILMYA